MLVLTRALGEVIRIGDATVTVVRLAGGKVRLGIEAPSEVLVRRAELSSELHPGNSLGMTHPAGPVLGDFC